MLPGTAIVQDIGCYARERVRATTALAAAAWTESSFRAHTRISRCTHVWNAHTWGEGMDGDLRGLVQRRVALAVPRVHLGTGGDQSVQHCVSKQGTVAAQVRLLARVQDEPQR